MVNNEPIKVINETEKVPPPMDESWWEAVLAEEEASFKPALPNRQPLPEAPASKPAAPRISTDLSSVDWEYAIHLYQQDEVICLQVSGYNRGGLLVLGEKLQGFVPISHLIEMPGNMKEAEQEEMLASYLERRLQLKVIECDQERGRVVFSERAALAQAGTRNQLLLNLKAGDCITGTVTNVTDFGVFVDLGGVEGLIHVSEISWGRVRHPSDVVKVDSKIEVYVINVDRERSRVGLSLKRLYPNPWKTAGERYYPGQVIEAVVTSIVSFGAFARLEEGLDGLIHISEMGTGKEPVNPAEEVYEGQRVRVRVLHVDAERQRLGLSLRIGQEEL